MNELKVVKLDKLDPNPWRDSSGKATWDSVAEVYGFDEAKLKELQQSYVINGVWAGVHVRNVGGRYQLAFGHHRVEAARRMGVASIPVVVADLADDDMLRMMASENSEEYGHDFALGVMNAVEAVIKAYGAGAIELEQPDPKTPPPMLSLVNGKKFTQSTVGTYLGWVSPGDGRPADKVRTAVAALEYIEGGALKRNDFKGLGAGQARELVTLTRRKIESEKEKLEVQQTFLEKQKQAALKDDDKRKVAQVEKKLVELESEGAKVVKQAGRQVASAVTGFFKEGSSYTEAAKRAAEALDVVVAKPLAKAPKKLDLSGVDDFAARLDASLLDDDPKFAKILSLAEQSVAKKTFKELELSLLNLAERAKLRAKELKKVVG